MHTKCDLCEDTEYGIVVVVTATTETGLILDRVKICQRCYYPLKHHLSNIGLTIGNVGTAEAEEKLNP
jgi:recombinational DNA repair protein RecR